MLITASILGLFVPWSLNILLWMKSFQGKWNQTNDKLWKYLVLIFPNKHFKHFVCE